jgi:holliday junction DNA helicase RuvA
MISRLRGTLFARDFDRIEVEMGNGVVYEVQVPLSVAQRLPAPGAPLEIRTVHVVREDSEALYGFLEAHERDLFTRLMGATGVGPKLALQMLSTYSARRLARALAEKDIAALTQISGIGKKKAETIALALSDRVRDLAVGSEGRSASGSGAEEAVAALVSLGYSFVEADEAVRKVLGSETPRDADELIRKALAERT